MSDQEQTVITLKKPLVLGEITHHTITVREPTIDEVDQATKQTTKLAVAIALLATVSGIPTAMIRKLPSSEFARATQAMSAFMPDSPETGGNLPQT
jgi:ABC-type dipeptide/oligopeptide/nickel transport system permease component